MKENKTAIQYTNEYEKKISKLFESLGWQVSSDKESDTSYLTRPFDIPLYIDNRLIGAVELKNSFGNTPNKLAAYRNQVEHWLQLWGKSDKPKFIIIFIDDETLLYTEQGFKKLSEIPKPETYKRIIAEATGKKDTKKEQNKGDYYTVESSTPSMVCEPVAVYGVSSAPEVSISSLITLVQEYRDAMHKMQDTMKTMQEEIKTLKASSDTWTSYAEYGDKSGKPSVYEGAEKYVFISYAHKDKAAVWPVIERMNKEGYRVWYDDGITPGSEWDKNIADHIDSSALLIAMMSNNYIQSENCMDELKYSRDAAVPQLIIHLEEVNLPNEIKMRMGRKQALHRYGFSNEEEFFKKLFEAEGLKQTREWT